ncbi:MAG TPA: serine/threonine-protein kinase [Streptosporangiaceae bacterium]|nr:serine/threonine-protein kinase [Streptosporangiaceae bacterium]
MSSASDVLLARRYRLVSRIAAGGYGEVWRATDTVLGRPVAIKLLRSGFFQGGARPSEAQALPSEAQALPSEAEETLARFRAEARHAGALSHENIAHVYDYGEPDPPQPPFLVMELIDGPSLAGVLARGPLPPRQVMDIVAQTAAGLRVAHQAGLVHRDIKPGNLLLSHGRVVKITDFGISHAAGSAPITQTGMLVGTAAYLAPERVSGGPATPASDLYSLGMVGYECLTGAAPFTGNAIEMALAHRDRPLPPLPPSVPPGVAALIAELTAKDPAARPASAADVALRAGQLRDQLAGGGTAFPAGAPAAPFAPGAPAAPFPAGAPTVPPGAEPGPAAGDQPTRVLAQVPGRGPRRGRAGRAAAIAAAAVVAAILIGVALAARSGPNRPLTPPPGQPTSHTPSAQLASVNSASLIGQPVDDVVRQLRQLGLQVRVLRQPSDQQPPGTVTSVSPSGQVPVGTLVTVIAVPQSHDQGHHHGHGGGNGNSRGD